MLKNDPRAAANAAKAAAEAVMRAGKRAAERVAATEKSEPGTAPHLASQQTVSEAARAAAELALKAAPDAAASLRKAAEHSVNAEREMRKNAPDKARLEQREAEERLREAEERLEAAHKRLLEEARKATAGQGKKAGALAKQARPVDPLASAALRRAEKEAQPTQRKPVGDSAAATKKHMQEAAGSLKQRQQELELDRRIADAIRRLAQTQQDARDKLARLHDELTPPLAPPGRTDPAQAGGSADEQTQTQKNGAPKPPSIPGQSGLAPPGQQQKQPEQPKMPLSGDKKLDDSKKLTSALGDYIGTQEDLGDLAEELSKQKKVANKPLNKALKEAAKLNPNLERAPRQDFIPPEEQPAFASTSKPRLPKQIAGSGAMPEQQPVKPGDTTDPIQVPGQEQGPQNPPSTDATAADMNNPQVQNPPEEGVNASTTVQTAPITSAPQPAAPPSAPGVFEPNQGAPKTATPSSQNTPPKPGKPNVEKGTKEELAERIKKEQEKRQKKRIVRRPKKGEEKQPPAPPPALGEGFKPESPEETARQLAGPEALDEAYEELAKKDELDDRERDLLGEEPEIEYVDAEAGMKTQPAPKEAPGKTGTTPGDLGMGQGTPGKGVGGEATGNPTEDRPQKGNQHGTFQGKRPWAKAPEDLVPKGMPFPPGFNPPPKKPDKPYDAFAPPKLRDDDPPMHPDADPQTPPDFGGGMGGMIAKGRRTGDAVVAPKQYTGAPWFSKLPEDLRRAIRSRGKTDPPPGYEDKLRRYRESID
jgi:hypothetical protein